MLLPLVGIVLSRLLRLAWVGVVGGGKRSSASEYSIWAWPAWATCRGLSVLGPDGLDPFRTPPLARILTHQARNNLGRHRLLGPRRIPVCDHHDNVRAGTEEEGGI